jgi:thiol:disulfide interchange protein DsbD
MTSLGSVSSADAAAPSPADEPLHVKIEALADQQAVSPGQTFRVAVVEHIQPGWHTYWINPGDAGQATKLRWLLPDGYRIDAVQWPVPQVFRLGPVVSYGYAGEVVLLQSVHAPERLAASPARFSVEAQWLACQEICIPEHAVTEVTVRQDPNTAHAASSASMTVIAAARERLPKPSPWGTSLAVTAKSAVLTIHGIARALPVSAQLQFLPLTWGEIDNAARQTITRSGADLHLTLTRGDLRSAPLEKLDGVLLLGHASGELQGQGFLLHAVADHTSAARAR